MSVTLWLDVTTILRWGRPATGVVRVEAEIFRRLVDEPGVRFCAFEAGRYVEHQAQAVLATLERNELGGAAPPADTFARRFVASADQVLRRTPLPVFKALAALKRASTPVVRGALHRVRQTSASWQRTRASRRSSSGAAGEPTTIFASGDVVISAGLDWDFKDLKALYALKRAHRLRVVLVCYDLIPVLFPHLCRAEVADVFPRYYADVAWVADHVLCISESSRRDFHAFVTAIGAPLPTTSLLRLGSTIADRSALATSSVSGPYVLFVSTIERRKNHEVLYRALVRFAEAGKALPKLVFVGMRGWGVDELLNDLQRDPRVRGAIELRHQVTDAELQTLYANAKFTVFPSLYEGWGLPVAESLAHGRFCLVANTSSLPEVGGELVEYLDARDAGAWAERIEHYLTHPEALRLREQAIAARFVPVSWNETARAVLAVARTLAQRHG